MSKEHITEYVNHLEKHLVEREIQAAYMHYRHEHEGDDDAKKKIAVLCDQAEKNYADAKELLDFVKENYKEELCLEQ